MNELTVTVYDDDDGAYQVGLIMGANAPARAVDWIRDSTGEYLTIGELAAFLGRDVDEAIDAALPLQTTEDDDGK
jgi:hypothetical protein